MLTKNRMPLPGYITNVDIHTDKAYEQEIEITIVTIEVQTCIVLLIATNNAILALNSLYIKLNTSVSQPVKMQTRSCDV